MAELLEEQESEQFDFQRYVDLVRRRHVYFLVPLFLGWLLVWSASWFLQTRYKSSTLILVQQPTMPESYVPPNVNENLQDRLQSITQQILSRTRLLMIIDSQKLYANPAIAQSPDDKVDRMRKDINVDLVRDSRNNEISAFRVSYSAHDPVVAQKVTSELTGLFINENQRVLQEESEDTTKFIEKQLEAARQSLTEQEAKVHQFEAAHEGALPTQQTSNLQILSGLQQQLQNEQDSLNTAKQQRIYFQTLSEQYKNLHSTRSVDGGPSDLDTINQELSKLRSQLADLSSRYTDRYPDVLKIKDQIAKTERLKAEMLSAPAGGKQGSNETSSNPTVLQLQSQIQANQAEILNREHAIASLQARINEYQNRLNQAPATEQQLAQLTRGYDQSKANYDDLLHKKTQSQMATSMEQMQQGERFTVLDPPSLPVKPDYPNRLKFCGMGVLVGMGLGLLTVLGFEFFDGRMHSEKEIKALLQVPVLAEIPEIQSPLDEQKQKGRTILGWALTAIVGTAIVLGSTFSFLRG